MLRRLNLLRLSLPLCLVGLVLLGAAGKLWCIHHYGSDLPDARQWSSGVPALLEQALGPSPRWSDSWPSEAHPIPALSAAVLAAEVRAVRQWDNRVIAVVNAAIHAAALAVLVGLLARRLSRNGVWVTAFSAAVLVLLPVAWMRTLAGSSLFEYLTLLTALPGVWLLLAHPAPDPRWFGGALLATAAALTSAFGALPWLAVGVIALARCAFDGARRGRHAVTAAVAGSLLVLFVLLPVPGLRFPSPAFARIGDLLAALAYPCGRWPWLLPLLHLPLALWFVAVLRDRDRKHSAAPLAGIVVLALLLLAQAVGSDVPGLGPEIVAVLLVLDVAAVMWLWHESFSRLVTRLGFTAAWLAAVVVGLQGELDRVFSTELQAALVERDATTLVVRQSDPAAADRVARHIATFRDRGLLPLSARTPVPIERGPATTANFVPHLAGTELPDPEAPAWVGGLGDESFAGTVFVSAPLPPNLFSVLQFRVAGDLGTPRFPFGLRSLRTGATVPLWLDRHTGQRWRTVNLERPEDPVVIVAGPSAPGAWGAFTAPTDFSHGSWFARKLAKNWMHVAWVGAATFALALIVPVLPRRRTQETYVLGPDGTLRTRPVAQ